MSYCGRFVYYPGRFTDAAKLMNVEIEIDIENENRILVGKGYIQIMDVSEQTQN